MSLSVLKLGPVVLGAAMSAVNSTNIDIVPVRLCDVAESSFLFAKFLGKQRRDGQRKEGRRGACS